MPSIEDFLNNPPADESGVAIEKERCNGTAIISSNLYSFLEGIATATYDGCDRGCDCCEPCAAATRLLDLLSTMAIHKMKP